METVAENMTGVAEDYIPRVALKVYRLLALMPEYDDLGLRMYAPINAEVQVVSMRYCRRSGACDQQNTTHQSERDMSVMRCHDT